MKKDKLKNKKSTFPKEENVDQNEANAKEGNNDFPGYPIYPSDDDIYHKEKEEKDMNPEYPFKTKKPNEVSGELNEKDFDEDMTGSDLDVPGSESENEQENDENEDEENDYYSLGGDDHENLDEDKGD
jgi:hypothetical protein